MLPVAVSSLVPRLWSWLALVLSVPWLVVVLMVITGWGTPADDQEFTGPAWQRALATAHRGLIHQAAAGEMTPGYNNLSSFALQPGDVLLMHDPHGAYGHYTHIGLALSSHTLLGQSLQRGIFVETTYGASTYNEVVVMRAPLPAVRRQAIADHARQWVDTPFALAVHKRDQRYRSCVSVAWQAWASQGIDLAPKANLLLPDDCYQPHWVVFRASKAAAAGKLERNHDQGW